MLRGVGLRVRGLGLRGVGFKARGFGLRSLGFRAQVNQPKSPDANVLKSKPAKEVRPNDVGAQVQNPPSTGISLLLAGPGE